jgi:hypothetical protein
MITPEPVAPVYASVMPDHDDPREAVRAWQAHIDAGRIGANPPVDPAIAANTARTAALFRSFHRRGGVW